MDFTDFILEDWEYEEEGNVKLNGLTEREWMNLYIKFLKKNLNELNQSDTYNWKKLNHFGMIFHELSINLLVFIFYEWRIAWEKKG